MPIVFNCPCGQRLQVPREQAGRRARCPACGQAVSVPDPGAARPGVEPGADQARRGATEQRAPALSVLGVGLSGRTITLAGVLVVVVALAVGMWYAVMPSRSAGPAPTSPAKPTGYVDALLEARHRGISAGAGVEMRQIGTALGMYRLDHSDALPDRLEDLRPYLNGFDQLITDARTGRPDRFIYVKPASVADPAHTPVLYEAKEGKRDPAGAVLYADGSVRLGGG